MVNVLAFLFENFLHRPIDLPSHMDQIARELPKVGFKIDDVDGAIDWLDETLKSSQYFKNPTLKASHGERLFSQLEMAKIDSEARGMIYSLEMNRLITPSVRELLIERAMALNTNSVGKEHMRWVILFVLMNTNARDDVIEWLEATSNEPVKKLIE